MTDCPVLGGPLSDERFFFPVRVIEVSPLSIRRVFSPAGVAVLLSEFLWVWLPAVVLGSLAAVARRNDRLRD